MARHQPPRIVHLIYALTTGGLENGLVNIINRCPPGRYEHIIVCLTTADEFCERITADNVRVIELHKPPGHDLRFYWRAWRLFRQLRPDIVHSRNLAALEVQLLTLGLDRIKRVHGEHGREMDDLDGSSGKYLGFRRFMRAFIHRYIPVSADLAAWLTTRVGVKSTRIRQIYNGVDDQRFCPRTVKPVALLPTHWQHEDDILVIGTVGRLTPVKDQRSLLLAAASLRESNPGLHRRLRVIIVGDGPLMGELTGLSNELGLDGVSWLPGDRDDVPELLAAMDIFVLPSLGEGISNTVLEAMACGLPVVATAVGGNVELVEPDFNGSLVPAGNVPALAAALITLLGDDAERARQGDNARQRICQRFDWMRTVDNYLDVYDELMQAPAANRMESID